MKQLTKEVNGFVIYTDGTMGYRRIKNTGSGAVPKQLRGLYTTEKAAVDAVMAYQPKRGAKSRDGEVSTTA